MVVELQQKTLDTFSNLTQKTTELNKNILDNSNIIVKAINNMNRNTNSNMSQVVFFLVSILKIYCLLLSFLKVFAKIILTDGW